MVRGSEKLSGVFGIEDVEISRHNFVLAGTFPTSCLDFNQKRFDTAFRREGKDSAQRIFNSGGLKVGEAGVDATNTVPHLKHNYVYLLQRYTGLYVSARPRLLASVGAQASQRPVSKQLTIYLSPSESETSGEPRSRH